MDLADDSLLANLMALEKRQNLPVDDGLRFLEDGIVTEAGAGRRARFATFLVEMETGTRISCS